MSYLEHTIQRKRIGIFFGFIFIFFAVIIFRLFDLQVMRNNIYLKMADKQHWTTRKIPAKRGLIYTTDIKTGEKNILATNETLNMVYAVPRQIKNKEEASKKLSDILGIDSKEISNLINNDKVYVPIKHKLNNEEVSKIEESDLLGIMLSPEEWRNYPEGELASHVVGFINNDGEGQYGIESYFNDQLKGKSGEVTLEKDNSGRQITASLKQENPVLNGQDIVLTIDRVIQSFAEADLKDAVEKHKSPGGSIIVMNPDNGDIWAMANYPTFDPNKYNEIKDYELFKNSAIAHLYEPGSIFKILTMAAGIDTGKIFPNTTYTDTGEVKIGGYTIRNASNKVYGKRTMTEVLENSINTGTIFIKDTIGNEVFYNYIKNFGLGRKTCIGLLGEETGVLKSFKSWKDINFATATFGQGIAVTPLQFITAASAIANGGELVNPNIVSRYILPDGSTKEPERTKKRVIKKETANILSAMMVSVVEKGHGKKAQIPGFRVAGKTGTAQIPLKDGNGYEAYKSIGSFILFVPAEDAKFIILVKIDEPQGVQWAESTAAPVAGELAKKILNYLEIPPNNKE